METEKLISDLIELTKTHINLTQTLKKKTTEELNWKESPEKWSVLECIEHLNRYGDFYIPEIEKTIANSKYKFDIKFKSGVLGNYFAQSMLSKEKLNKMNTFKDKNPLNSKFTPIVIDVFINQQLKFIDLLNKSKKVNLTKEKVKITFTKWIRLRLGDTLKFVIYHNCTHLFQIEKIILSQK